jgi:hypothetical protein
MINQVFIDNLWKDKAVVFEMGTITRPNRSTGHDWVRKSEIEQCHLSFQKLSSATQGESFATTVQVVKLFCSHDHEIKEGSKIVTTKPNGKVYEHYASGESGTYSAHQEVMLSNERET